jgi:hypothetical protein
MLANPTRPWASMSAVQALVGESAEASTASKTGMDLTNAISEQACDPTLPEPNHAVNIELAELINKKKANRSVISALRLQRHIQWYTR